jgi:hypothetical protein
MALISLALISSAFTGTLEPSLKPYFDIISPSKKRVPVSSPPLHCPRVRVKGMRILKMAFKEISTTLPDQLFGMPLVSCLNSIALDMNFSDINNELSHDSLLLVVEPFLLLCVVLA